MLPRMPLTILLGISMVVTVKGGSVRTLDDSGNPCSYRSNGYWCAHGGFCIPREKRCNYDNDCGDAQDEKYCNELMYTWETRWNDAGKGDTRYLDRHRVFCQGNVLKNFVLNAAGNTVGYVYTCSLLRRRNICKSVRKSTRYNDSRNGNAVALGRQS